MEKELQYALKLLNMTLSELQTKMYLTINEEIELPQYTTIYTDGACPNNGNKATKASIGIFFGDNDSRNISSLLNISNPSNNRAELYAILVALENSSGSVELCSDSQYAISCLTKWIKNWQKNNWKTTTGKPVKNKEILIDIYEKMKNRNVRFRHVSNFNHKIPKNKTNKDHYGNYMADKLANDAL